MEGARKRGRLGKIWKGEVEENSNIIGLKHRQAMV
jgi:hypothetical protein